MFSVTTASLPDFEEPQHLFYPYYIRNKPGRLIKSRINDYGYTKESIAWKYDNWNQFTIWNHNLYKIKKQILTHKYIFEAKLCISITTLSLINFELLRMQWNAIEINNTYCVRNNNIDRNRIVIHNTLYTGNFTRMQTSNLFMHHTCTIDDSTALDIIDSSQTNQTFHRASIIHCSQTDKFESCKTESQSLIYLLNMTNYGTFSHSFHYPYALYIQRKIDLIATTSDNDDTTKLYNNNKFCRLSQIQLIWIPNINSINIRLTLQEDHSLLKTTKLDTTAIMRSFILFYNSFI